jgi:hypothetical protein
MIENDFIIGMVRSEAEKRTALHRGRASQRPLGKNYDEVGLAGEFEFGKWAGLFPDLEARTKGDKGIDFRVLLRYTVDVKTARRAYSLLHEQGKPLADIYVLAEYDDETGEARLVGWEWGKTVARAPVIDLGRGVLNHSIDRSALRPMSELEQYLFRPDRA